MEIGLWEVLGRLILVQNLARALTVVVMNPFLITRFDSTQERLCFDSNEQRKSDLQSLDFLGFFEIVWNRLVELFYLPDCSQMSPNGLSAYTERCS